MDESDNRGPRERAYDEHVFPLMREVIRLCKEHDVGVFATFAIGDEEDPALCCTTNVPCSEPSDALAACYAAFVRVRNPPPLMLTVKHGDGSVTKETILR